MLSSLYKTVFFWKDHRTIDEKLSDLIFDLKFLSYQFQTEFKNTPKKVLQQITHIKKAVKNKNIEAAKIYAETAIRLKNEGQNALKVSAKIDAAISRLERAQKINLMTTSIKNVVELMESTQAGKDAIEFLAVMDKFEEQLGNIDVVTETMQSSIGNSTIQLIPDDQVTALINEISEEHELKTKSNVNKITPKDPDYSKDMDELTEKLNKLKN